MAICTVAGDVVDPADEGIQNVRVDFAVQSPTVAADPRTITTSTASNGVWTMDLQQGLSGVFTFWISPDGVSRTIPYRFNVVIPATATAEFYQILVD